MKKVITTVVLIITITLCTHIVKAELKPEPKQIVKSVFGMELIIPENKITKCEIIKKHHFSDLERIDTFKLIYNVENLEDSTFFQIVDFSGKLIYEKRFSGISFYDYGRPWYVYVTDPKRGKDMKMTAQNLSTQVKDSLHKADIQYIKKQMNNFFNDDRFITNPVMKLDKKHLNEFHYDGINGDSTVIGFKIHLFVEGFEMIAYSKKMQKVQFIASAD